MATSVSIVVPLRNEARHLDRFVGRLAGLRYGRGAVELFLVEGDSTDGTRARLESALPTLRRAHPGWRIEILRNPGGRIPRGLNLGVRAATGDVIVRLDAHTLFPPDYLEACVAVLERTGAANVGGVVATDPGADTPMARAIARARSDRFGAGGSSFRTGATSGPRRTVPFGCWPRATFARFGLFEERLHRNQDIEFNGRIRAGGGAVHQEGSIVSRYLAPASLGALARKHFANGEWNVYATAVRPGCLSRAHAVPAAYLAGVAAAGVLQPWAAPALLAGLYLLDLGRALKVGKELGPFRLATAFFTIQMGHGLGQLKGALGLPGFLLRNRGSGAAPGRASGCDVSLPPARGAARPRT
jgi:glycosyltransferase involved in cell wall biosynthesis